MLSPEIRAQVETVLKARQIEDKAFQAVMKITKGMSIEDIEMLQESHAKAARMVSREENYLANMIIRSERESVTS